MIKIIYLVYLAFLWVQIRSFTQSCLTLCDPMDCSRPGLPVHHKLLEFTQTHVHWVSDAIQPSHSLSSPSPPNFNLSKHQGLFKWVSSSWPKHWSFSFCISPSNEHPHWSALGWTGWSPCSPRDSQESSPIPQFKTINFSALSFLSSPTFTSIHDYWKKQRLDSMDLCWQSNDSAF